MIKADSTGVAVIDTRFPYYPLHTCPIGQKVILRGKGGVGVMSQWNGKDKFWTHWAPLPVLIEGISDAPIPPTRR